MDNVIDRSKLGRDDGVQDTTFGPKERHAPGFDSGPGVNPSVVLISPNPEILALTRRMMEAQRATIVKEFAAYPTYPSLDALQELDFSAVVVAIDSDLEVAMDVVEALCVRKPSTTVMVYSMTNDGDRMVRSMRAGAREFLTSKVTSTVLQEALLRAVARHMQQIKKIAGSTIVFWSAKGGSGVTTIATNFALALRGETAAEVALLDLNPQLGDIAVLLGLTPRFTVAEALRNPRRIDHELISSLMTEHPSGISVLAAPD